MRQLFSKYVRFFSVLLIGFMHGNCISQTETRKYNDNNVYVNYTVTKGMLNGSYIAYYENGKKKAEGEFSDNVRVGKWSVWDSVGKLCIQRVYTNSFDYEVIAPRIPNGPAKLLSAPLYKPTRNIDSCFKYYYLEERQVIWSKRTWSFIYNKDNPLLGKNNKMFDLLYKQMIAHNIKLYKFINWDWDKSFFDTIDISKLPFDTSRFEVIGFLTKEDWFYNIDMGIMDSRLLGLCPIAIRKHLLIDDTVNAKYLDENKVGITNDTIGLCWIYYPQTRKYLAKDIIKEANIPKYIKNLDDIFFCKYYDYRIKGDVSHNYSTLDESWQARLKLIDIEHDIWLGNPVN